MVPPKARTNLQSRWWFQLQWHKCTEIPSALHGLMAYGEFFCNKCTNLSQWHKCTDLLYKVWRPRVIFLQQTQKFACLIYASSGRNALNCVLVYKVWWPRVLFLQQNVQICLSESSSGTNALNFLLFHRLRYPIVSLLQQMYKPVSVMLPVIQIHWIAYCSKGLSGPVRLFAINAQICPDDASSGTNALNCITAPQVQVAQSELIGHWCECQCPCQSSEMPTILVIFIVGFV